LDISAHPPPIFSITISEMNHFFPKETQKMFSTFF
jgi:hypothetical protein